jgi:hypothetical protein
MQIIGHVCAPLMSLFGLPGEAITVLLTSWLASCGNRRGGEPVEQRHPQWRISRFSSRRFSSWVRSFSTWGACSAWRMSRKILAAADGGGIINAVIAMLVMRVIA